MTQTTWTPPLPTVTDLVRQLGAVAADLPRFVAAPLRRRRHRTWGATPAEVAAPMAGDDLLPRAQYRSTRAITIAVPPDQVWPWLVQVGCGRAGWYASDLLDNFARPSVRYLVPELQHIEVGQWLPWVMRPSERLSFIVDSFDEPQMRVVQGDGDRAVDLRSVQLEAGPEQPSWLLWRSRARSWSWRLTPLAGGQTRLVSRMNTFYDWRRPGTVITVVLMEVADYAMMRRMLRGIKARAEA